MLKNKDIKTAIKKGFLHIFSANFINKIIQFGITILLVRIINKKLYGSFTYAQNILNMFLLLQGLGVVPGILQFCSEAKTEEKKLSYFKYGLKIGVSFNLIICFSILIFTLFFPLPIKGSSKILMSLFLFPVFSILYDEIQVYLRAILKNKEFSVLTVTNSLLYLIGNLALGILFSVGGIVASRYISYLVSIILGFILIKKYVIKIKDIKYPTKDEKKEFLKFSIVSSITNAISQVLFLIDTFLVGMIIKDQSVVAAYKTATLIPFNLIFIPTSIMIFVYPYFAQHYNDKKWIKDKFNILQKYLFILNSAISLILIIFAPLIIQIIFGKEYLDAVTPFRILSFGYLIAGTFRVPGGNILFSIKRVKVNFYNSIISGIANIIFDVVLILKYGSNGAAMATVIIFALSSLISNGYLYKYLRE